MRSHLFWLQALLNIPRLLSQWRYVRKLPHSQLQKLMTLEERKERPMILDVRSREEFTGELGHLEGAVLLPLPELDSRLYELTSHRMQTIVTV